MQSVPRPALAFLLPAFFVLPIVAHAAEASGALPGRPETVDSGICGRGCVEVTWHWPADHGCSSIVAFEIQTSIGQADDFKDAASAPVPIAAPPKIQGLPDATNVYIRVAARNDCGIGPYSDPPHSRTTATVPSPPLDLVASQSAPGVVHLTWRANWDGGLAVASYTIERRAPGDDDWTVVGSAPPGTSGEDPEVDDGSYEYQVRAVNEVGASEPSGVARAEMETDRPKAPTGVAAQPGLAPGSVHVSWDAADSTLPLDAYDVRRSVGGGPFELAGTVPGDATSFDDERLPPGDVVYDVRARNDAGRGPASASAETSLAVSPYPGTPRSFKVAEGSRPGSLLLSWRPPETWGHGSFHGYVMTRLDDGRSWSIGGEVTTFEDAFLPAGPHEYALAATSYAPSADIGYSGHPARAEGRSTRPVVVAFGDSVAAGHGFGAASGYDPATDSFSNHAYAYPAQLAAAVGGVAYSFAVTGACSVDPYERYAPLTCHQTANGEVEQDVLHQLREAEGAKMLHADLLSPSLVTLSVGGNDIEFARCLAAVLAADHIANPCEGATFEDRLAAFERNLGAALDLAHSTFPSAPIVLTAYGNPLPPPEVDACKMWEPTARLGWGTAQNTKMVQASAYERAGGVLDRLNGVMRKFESSIVRVAQPNYAGHDVCASERGVPVSEVWAFPIHWTTYIDEAPVETFQSAVRCPDTRWESDTTVPAPLDPLVTGLEYVVFHPNCVVHPTVEGHHAIAETVLRRLAVS